MVKEDGILIEALIAQGLLDSATHERVKSKILGHYLLKGFSETLVNYAQGYRVIPLFLLGMDLTVAFIDPPYEAIVDLSKKETGYKIVPVITTMSDYQLANMLQKADYDELTKKALSGIVALEDMINVTRHLNNIKFYNERFSQI